MWACVHPLNVLEQSSLTVGSLDSLDRGDGGKMFSLE